LIVLNSVLFIFSLFLIVGLLPPVQLYSSTTLCDPSFNLTNLTSCDEESPSSSTFDTETTDNSQSDNTETPLIIPDISTTSKDLDDAMTDGDLATTDTDATDDVSDDDNSENQDVDSDSSNSEGGSSDSETSLIPFP
jgi:hypothetical protein